MLIRNEETTIYGEHGNNPITTKSKSMTDAELLANIIGNKKIASDILKKYNSLFTVFSTNDNQLKKEGLSDKHILKLRITQEINSRKLDCEIAESPQMLEPSLVKKYLIDKLGGKRNEHFAILFLNNKNRPQAYQILFNGTIDSASVYPRVIMAKVLEYNSAAVILVHNHPSGDCKPSKQDQLLTDKIKNILNQIDVRIIDHFIVAKNKCFSIESGKEV